MGLLDTLFGTDNGFQAPVLDALTSVKVEPLPPAQLEYMNNVAVDLGYERGSIQNKEDWDAMNANESARIKSEEEGSLRTSVEAYAVSKANMSEIQSKAIGLARLDDLGETVPSAAALSAERERLAETAVINPQNLGNPLAYQRWLHSFNERSAINEDRINHFAIKESDSSLLKNLTLEMLPVVNKSRIREAMEALGFSNLQDYSYDQLMLLFGETVASMTASSGISTLDHMEAWKEIEERWDKAEIDPYVQNKLVSSLKYFEPDAETYEELWRIAGVAPAAGTLGRAAKLFKSGHKGLGMYKIAAAGAEAVLPYGEAAADRMAEFTFKGVSKGASAVEKAYQSIPFIKARRERDREAARAIAESIYGAPTEAQRSWEYSNKKAVFDFTDHAMHPVADVRDSVSNDAFILGLKIDKEVSAALNQFAEGKRKLDELVKAGWTSYVKNDLVDTLRMNKIIGAGRGVGINDIISAFDTDLMLEKTGEDISVVVRLKNPANSSKYMSSVWENAPEELLGKRHPKNFNQGFLAAQERGKKLSGGADKVELTSAKGDPVTISYGVDEVNGEYFTVLKIDTHKGIGTLHFDRLQREGKVAQEEWRAFASSWATVTSMPTDIGIADVARELDAAAARVLGDQVLSAYKELPKAERKLLQALADLSTQYEAFYSTEDLIAKGLSEKGARAYAMWRAMNDFDDFIRNEYTFRDLLKRGAKSISFNGKSIEGFGRVVPGINSWTDMRDAATGKSSEFAKPRGLLINRVDVADMPPVDPFSLSEEQWKDYFYKGYRLIEGSLSPEEGLGARTFYYLLDPSATVINDLPQFVTHYVAGGRRYFDRKRGFVKQLRLEKTYNGRESIVGTRTFFTDADTVGLKRRVEKELEPIRKLIIQGRMKEATDIIAKANWHKTEIYDAESFKAYFEQLGMDFTHLDNALEVVENGKILDSYKTMKAAGIEDMLGFDTMERMARNSHFQAISNEAKQLKKKRTGRELLTWDFEKAQTVDFEQQIRYLVNDMVFNNTMGLYTDIYSERFFKAFEKVIDKPRGYQMTAREALISGKITGNSDQARLARAAQANYAAIRGVPSALDSALASNFNRMMDWIGGVAEGVLPISEKAAHNVRVLWKDIMNADPLMYMRSFTSHWYLGCMNFSQLYKQMASDLSILLLEPKAAMRALPHSLQATSILMLSKGNKEKALQLAEKIYSKDKNMLQNMRTIIDLGAFEHGTAGGFFEKGFSTQDKLNKLSMLFFNTGEMQNRATAFLSAIYSMGLDGKKLTATQKLEVAKRAQTLFMNMDSAGLSRIQRGTAEKTLFQFMGYRMRWAEQVMFNKELTRAQKIRLGLGTLALTGTQGFLGVGASTWIASNLYNMFTSSSNDDVTLEDRNEFAEFVQKGIINYFSEIFGIDMDLSQPFSLEYAELIDSILGLSNMDFAAPQVAGKALSSVFEIIRYMRDSVIGEATAKDFGNLLDSLAIEGKLPSSVRIYLGARLFQTGRALSSKGELNEYYDGVLRKVLYSLGFNSLHSKEISRAFMQARVTQEAVKECEDAAYTMLTRALRIEQEGGDPTRDYQYFDATIKLSGLDERIQAKIFRDTIERASKNTGTPALARRLAQQMKSAGLYGNNVIQLVQKKGEYYGR